MNNDLAEKLRAEFSSHLNLAECLESLNQENMDNVYEEIKDNHLDSICSYLASLAPARPKEILLLINFASKFDNIGSTLMNSIFNEIASIQRSMVAETFVSRLVYFLKAGIDSGLFSKSELIRKIHDNHKLRITQIYVFLYEEISQDDEILDDFEEYFQRFLEDGSDDEDNANGIFHFYRMDKSDTEHLRASIKAQQEPNSIGDIILHDRVHELEELAAKPCFDPNAKIPYSVFDLFMNDYDEFSLAEYAVVTGSVQCLKFLISKGAILLPNSDIAFYAISSGNPEIIKIIDRESISFQKCLHQAIISHQNDVAIWLIQNQIDIPKINSSAMGATILSNNFPMFIELFNYLFCSEKLFSRATLCARKEFCQVFCYLRIKVSTDVLIQALTSMNTDILKMLLDLKDVNPNGEIGISTDDGFRNIELNPLMYAIKNRYIEPIKLLLGHPKIDINRCISGIYPIEYAVTCPEIFDLLFNDKRIVLTGMNGAKALYKACETKSFYVFQKLINSPKIWANHSKEKKAEAIRICQQVRFQQAIPILQGLHS